MEHANAVGADDEHGQPQGDKQRRYGNRRTSRSADPWAGLRRRPMLLRERELVHLFQIGSSNGVLDELGEATANVRRDARAAMSLGRRGARRRAPPSRSATIITWMINASGVWRRTRRLRAA
jgi:hypothetical protein